MGERESTMKTRALELFAYSFILGFPFLSSSRLQENFVPSYGFILVVGSDTNCLQYQFSSSFAKIVL